MKNFQPLLMSLLRLDANLLDSVATGRLRESIRVDQSVRQKWKSLQDAIGRRWSETPHATGKNGVPTISPRWIAAFLEDRLDPERLERIESACWQHPRLLQSVVELFQLQQTPVTKTAENPLMTDRLLKMEVAADSVLHTTPVEPIPQIQVRSRDEGRKPQNKRSGPGLSRVSIFVAASVLGLASAGTAWLIWQNMSKSESGLAGKTIDNSIVKDREAIPKENLPILPDEKEPLVPKNDSLKIVKAPVDAETIPDPDAPLRDPVRVPEKLANDPPKKIATDVANDKPEVPAIPDNDVPMPVFEVAWTGAEGLVAVRNPGDTKWSGIGAPGFVPRDGLTSFVLPGSLVRMRLGSLGTLHMAPNTIATWHVDPLNRIVDVELGQGGLLLAGAPVGTVLQVDDGLKKWSITIDEEKTEVGIDGETELDEPGSRLFLADGKATVNGVQIQRRQQIVWMAEQRNGVTRFSGTPDWVRNKLDKSFEIPRQLALQLIDSDDLAGDMQQMLASDNAEHQDAARFCLASIDPQVFENAFLANVDPRIRQQGITWLMQFQDSQQGLRKVAVQFARTYQAAEMGRALPRIVHALRTNRRPAYADAGALVSGLNHAEQPARQLASDLLDRIFGTRVPYQAGAAPAARERAANAWQNHIDEAYGQSANRRRGQ